MRTRKKRFLKPGEPQGVDNTTEITEQKKPPVEPRIGPAMCNRTGSLNVQTRKNNTIKMAAMPIHG